MQHLFLMSYSFSALPPSGFQSTQGRGRGSQVADTVVPAWKLCNIRAHSTAFTWAKVCTAALEIVPPGQSFAGYGQLTRRFLQQACCIFCNSVLPHVKIYGDGKPENCYLKGCKFNILLSRLKKNTVKILKKTYFKLIF